MELHTLRCFVGVADQLSFSRASEQLHLSQPALSRQVRALEDELKMPLFDRVGRRVKLTSGGGRTSGPSAATAPGFRLLQV